MNVARLQVKFSSGINLVLEFLRGPIQTAVDLSFSWRPDTEAKCCNMRIHEQNILSYRLERRLYHQRTEIKIKIFISDFNALNGVTLVNHNGHDFSTYQKQIWQQGITLSRTSLDMEPFRILSENWHIRLNITIKSWYPLYNTTTKLNLINDFLINNYATLSKVFSKSTMKRRPRRWLLE